MADMSPEAISARWENGLQIRDLGGWCKVKGQPDPRQDIRALLSRVSGSPKPALKAKPKASSKPRKKRVTSKDSTPTDE